LNADAAMTERRSATGIGMTSARTRDRLIVRLREQGIANEEVLERIRAVPRHLFVDEALASRAYEDTALPIGHGQTISQPYIVARMTEALLEGSSPRKVLEVGTGCGYQTSVLAPLVVTLYSIERIAALQTRARRVLRELKLGNVHMKHGDGFEGWAAYAPFDGIICAAAAYTVPTSLLEQLGDGGRLIIPVGPDREQQLLRITRRGDRLEREILEPVTFVPLLHGLT
jgi:protein-L-isoaspartate(D-aspartate) O-methyltransferase